MLNMLSNRNRWQTHLHLLTTLLCMQLICIAQQQLSLVHAAIHSRSNTASAANYLAAAHEQNTLTDAAGHSKNSEAVVSAASIENTDLMDKLSWKCANNASCLHKLANSIMQSYRRGETVKLGLFDLVKLPPSKTESGGRKLKQKWSAAESGRGISTFMDFIGGNAIRIPVGPMVFSVQRAEDDSDYIEVALLKKAASQGRLQSGNGGGGLRSGGGGSGGSLLGGGNSGGLLGGGDIGGGGLLEGGGGGGRRRQGHQDKKQFQMYIPMYLAASTFGWTMVAAKAVGLLTLKALLLSKIAFVVAAIVLVKKFMENASDKMMYQFPEHTPYMMPYGMDYGPMHGAEMGTDMFPGALHLAAAAGGQMPHQGHPGLEGLAAESHLHPHIADVHNNTQVLAALNAVGLGQKVKRDDSWIAKSWPRTIRNSWPGPYGRRRPFYASQLKRFNRQKSPVITLIAAAAAAEASVEADSDDLYDYEDAL